MKKIIRKKKYVHERRTMLTHISQDAGAALAHFCRYGKKSGVVAFGEIERVHAKSHRNARISRAERPRLSRGRRRTALDALDGAREDGVGAIPGRHGRGGLGQHNKHDDNSGGPIARAGAAHYSRVFGPGGPRQGGCQHPSLMNSSESQTARSARVLVLRFPWYRQAHWPSALDVGDACPWSGDDLTPPSSETTEMKTPFGTTSPGPSQTGHFDGPRWGIFVFHLRLKVQFSFAGAGSRLRAHRSPLTHGTAAVSHPPSATGVYRIGTLNHVLLSHRCLY